MKPFSKRLFLLLLVIVPTFTWAQLETGVSYIHESGNNGLNGVSPSLGWQLNRYVVAAIDGDFLWGSSKVGVFDTTASTGSIRIKTDSQNLLAGAMVRFVGWKATQKLEKRKILPFAEVLLGESRIHQEIRDFTGTLSARTTATNFTWDLGGGVDYTIDSHWLARANIDLLRSHFIAGGQSHFRFRLGVVRVF
ncbi:MAG TPA: hypothetical protein VFA71_11715 [Terriglobales bacterium]|nr:hypothetical protein [Terriglobales bacterium]